MGARPFFQRFSSQDILNLGLSFFLHHPQLVQIPFKMLRRHVLDRSMDARMVLVQNDFQVVRLPEDLTEIGRPLGENAKAEHDGILSNGGNCDAGGGHEDRGEEFAHVGL